MSAVTVSTLPPAVSIGRLTTVELRKAVDTRSGRWLLIIIGIACISVAILQILFEEDPLERGVRGVYVAQHGTALVLLPIVGILLVTSEWSRRTTLTTYALTPVRNRITTAKGGAGVLLAVATSALLLLVAAVLNLLLPLWSEVVGRWDFSLTLAVQSILVAVVAVLGGVAFGLALQSSALAIVLYFVLPIALSVVAEIVQKLQAPLLWADINVTLPVLYTTGVTGIEWARAGTSVLVWVVVPFVIGAVRTSRREVV